MNPTARLPQSGTHGRLARMNWVPLPTNREGRSLDSKVKFLAPAERDRGTFLERASQLVKELQLFDPEQSRGAKEHFSFTLNSL